MQTPKHPKTRCFAETNLFKGISTFEELERRIESLRTSNDRGDAFEVFAEAFLATQPVPQATNIYPLPTLPPSIIKKLGFVDKDMGVDGVFEDALGNLNAYQVKFRSGRPSLTWDELSTFFGLTDKAATRVLFTNSVDVPPLLENRTGFYCIRGTDLERLQALDFERIFSWLQGTSIPRAKKIPLSHQTEALASLVPVLTTKERATAVMACGSGKTLVALWCAEKLGARKVIVLLPTLALLRQTLHEWLKETRWDAISYVCVCSDPTVTSGLDELVVKQADLDFPVSTKSDIVRKFLDLNFDGTKVVFSTYQSSRVVAQAMRKDELFDFGVFDEAHKTAGREGIYFNYALQNKNLSIRKRLFLTATPRHYDLRHSNKLGDSRLVFSMDAPEAYGNIEYKLSFAKAVREDIICDYKVVISVVTTEMITNELISRGEVIVSGVAVKARQVANQIALLDALSRYSGGKVFTFHRSIKSAASFTSDRPEGISSHLPNYKPFTLTGACRPLIVKR